MDEKKVRLVARWIFVFMLKSCIILHPCLRFEVLRLAKTRQESRGAGFQNIVCLSGYRSNPPLQTSLRLKATAERQLIKGQDWAAFICKVSCYCPPNQAWDLTTMTASRTCDMLSHQYRSEGVAMGEGVPERHFLKWSCTNTSKWKAAA